MVVLTDINKICVVGAGTMGAGIAQCCAQAGYKVAMVDTKAEFIQRGIERIKATLAKGIQKGKVTEAERDAVIANIECTTELKAGATGAELIIEAVFENMELKRQVFRELDEYCGSNVIFTTNTSTLSITELGAATSRPDKFAGLHFFNPAPINRLVEVIPGDTTSTEFIELLMDFARILGKTPILIKDSPGFAVNRFFVPFLNEACRMLEEEQANIPTIDHAAKEALGIGMGPFELMNFTGIPIAYHAQTTLYNKFGAFYKPADALKRQFEANELWKLDGEVDSTAIEPLKARFLGGLFGIVCQVVEEGVAEPEDVERGALVGLRWKIGPFGLMNQLGIEKALELVTAFSNLHKDVFEVPGLLRAQAEKRANWYLKNVRLKKFGNLATIYMDRPEALNALNTKILRDLEATIQAVRSDPEVSCVIITGEGNAFVAGADIKEMMAMTPLQARSFTQFGHHVLKQIETLDKVVIAAINGYALGGGCELALACDIIIASDKARLGLPEVSLGIHPGFGGTQRLPRLVGSAKAKELIFTGDMISAQEAERIGLVNRVVPHTWLMDECRKLAHKISSRGPIAVKLAKNAINRGLEVDLDTGLAYEIESVSLTFSTEDLREGMKAFTEKRKPKFRGT
jgi:enoyl-CoA hydratase/3-hydroxyacyl-CoA dehydrogenase